MADFFYDLFGIYGPEFVGPTTMPYSVFVALLKHCLPACVLIAVVLLARLLLRKAPKWISCALWALVALRLICPFTIESTFSVMPNDVGSGKTVDVWMDSYVPGGYTVIYEGEDGYETAVDSGRPPEQDADGSKYVVTGVGVSDLPETVGNRILPYLFCGWIFGMAVMLLYAVISYLRLKRRTAVTVSYAEGILMCDEIDSPFILGVFRPRIYLPSRMTEPQLSRVLAHEKAHLKRHDHWWKPLGFLLLSVYWFNPLVWVAYVLLCRDIEMACDERVVRDMDTAERADYAQALLDCSRSRRVIAACPLAFGEVGVKERVKGVLSFKKPAFWVIAAALIVCGVVAVCFLTSPSVKREFPMSGKNISAIDTDTILSRIANAEKQKDTSALSVNSDNDALMLTAAFDLKNDGAIRFFYLENQKTYCAQLKLSVSEDKYSITEREEWPKQGEAYKLQHYLNALRFLPQKEVLQLSSDADAYSVRQVMGGTPDDYDRVLTYGPSGLEKIDGWHIHLVVQPIYVFDKNHIGFNEEEIHLFYAEEKCKNRIVFCESTPSDNTDNARFLTLNDVKRLAQKGEALTWEDFDPFTYKETGSGLYIRDYPINGHFYLLIGSETPGGEILYIDLINRDTRATIDIRTQDVEDFLKEYAPVYDLNALRSRYPEYFDLPVDKGLEVYVWQMAENSYSCGVLPGTDREKTLEELMNLKGVSLGEMGAILSTYDIDADDIVVIPWQNPISSYIADYWVVQNEEDLARESYQQAYIDTIRSMLFNDTGSRKTN